MLHFLTTGWRHRSLLMRLARREFEARYRGSALGVAWAALLPLVMIGIYTFVFTHVMRTRWVVSAETTESVYSFAMLMFTGYILFSFFADAIGRAPGLMLENPSYIKKVVFPLEVLPWVAVVNALIGAGIALAVFMVLFLLLYGLPPLTILLLPFVVTPLVLITLGATYFLASFGVFLRDLRQFIPLITTALLFLSPVLYPLGAVPERFRAIISLNPLTIGVTEARQVIFWGEVPNLAEWGLYTVAGVLLASLGHWWFMRTKKAFADVV